MCGRGVAGSVRAVDVEPKPAEPAQHRQVPLFPTAISHCNMMHCPPYCCCCNHDGPFPVGHTPPPPPPPPALQRTCSAAQCAPLQPYEFRIAGSAPRSTCDQRNRESGSSGEQLQRGRRGSCRGGSCMGGGQWPDQPAASGELSLPDRPVEGDGAVPCGRVERHTTVLR